MPKKFEIIWSKAANKQVMGSGLMVSLLGISKAFSGLALLAAKIRLSFAVEMMNWIAIRLFLFAYKVSVWSFADTEKSIGYFDKFKEHPLYDNLEKAREELARKTKND